MCKPFSRFLKLQIMIEVLMPIPNQRKDMGIYFGGDCSNLNRGAMTRTETRLIL
jgi:hypothetical protein